MWTYSGFWCLFHDLLLFQVDGSMYKLLTKKEKAHGMDINSVQWSSGVNLFFFFFFFIFYYNLTNMLEFIYMYIHNTRPPARALASIKFKVKDGLLVN